MNIATISSTLSKGLMPAFLALIAVCALSLSGCNDKAETAGQKIDNSAEKAADATEKAADKTVEATEDAADATEDAAKDATK